MEWTTARARFALLATAFDGTGGFAPRVRPDADGTLTLSGPTELVRYPRESDAKFAARNAVAVYENHLRSACERFVGFLGRKRPQRTGADGALASLMAADADLRGTPLDVFWTQFALQARARGSMLLVIDLPDREAPASLADQVARRAVPYVRAAAPETIVAYRLDADSGAFVSVTLADTEEDADGALVAVERDYDATAWRVRKAGSDVVIREGDHAFGACPVLAFTENGLPFPVVGKYAQIADLSRDHFNVRSELRELHRSQTFSLLTMQIPAEATSQFDAVRDKVTATIGTHSLLMHPGDTPAFISPSAEPAERLEAHLGQLESAIRRIGAEESTETGTQAESGVARRLRFEALNADLATFAGQLQALEARMWVLWNRALNTTNGVAVTWPTDFNLADVAAELDILTLMQATGFPTAALNAKRRAIAAAEFDNAPDDEKAAIAAAIDELEQQAARSGAPSNT